MARLIKTVQGELIRCKVITVLTDGTELTRTISVDDVVEGLRYIDKEALYSITGKVVAINLTSDKITPVNPNKPEDYFSKDIKVASIVIDASEQYASNVVTVDAREIVEDEGVQNVERVYTVVEPDVTLEMTYTDGTTVQQDIEVGDVLGDAVIRTTPGKPDIKGDFKLVAFNYAYVVRSKSVLFNGIYLKPLSGGPAINVLFDNIVKFTEESHAEVADPTSLSSIATALESADEVYAFIDTDVTIPLRDDGRITSLFIDAGKTLTVDLNGHNINTAAYAFYVNGGELIIRDTSGDGAITASLPDAPYPTVFVASSGTCTMESGVIDVSNVTLEEGQSNWLYGVVCSGDGVFNMTGGQIITQDAAGISITNGTASGSGAQFNISGDAVITSKDCTAIYLADNKSVNISGKAVINGGVLLRMGDLNVTENAVINGAPASADIYPLGKLVCESGCENHNAAILALTGCYGSTLGNDLNITIKDFAKVNSHKDNAIDIATLNTKFDQKVVVNIGKASNVKYPDNLWNVYDHDTLAQMATEQGKTLAPETKQTDLTVIVEGNKVN